MIPSIPPTSATSAPRPSTCRPVLRTEDRLLYPQLRPHRDAELARVPWQSWPSAPRPRASARSSPRHGPDAVAFYGSGQLLTEEYYVASKLAKGFLGTNNFDTNSRLCMASAVASATRARSAPTARRRLRRHRARRLLLPDRHQYGRLPSRRSGSASASASSPPPTTSSSSSPTRAGRRRPTSPICTCRSGRARTSRCSTRCCTCSSKDGLLDHAFVRRPHVGLGRRARDRRARIRPSGRRPSPGSPPEIIVAAARRFGRARAALTLWSMGINQSHVGTDKNAAILNLHLATGQIGRPGAGPFSLTGQPNAMGGRETGRPRPSAARATAPSRTQTARAAVERHWGVPPGRIAPSPGRSALEIFEGLASGEVRAVWILCTNPAASMPDLDIVEKALRQAELVIVQDAYHPTETTRFADVLLPAAQWPEKDGVMTNSERRLTYPAQARRAARRGPARRGHRHALRARDGLEGAAFRLRARGRDLRRVRGADGGHAVRLLGREPRAAPGGGAAAVARPARRSPGHASASTPTAASRPRTAARASSRSSTIRPSSRPTRDYPLTLTTGRVRDHWHTLTRTGKSPGADARARREPLSRSISATPGARASATATSWRSHRGEARRWRRRV